MFTGVVAALTLGGTLTGCGDSDDDVHATPGSPAPSAPSTQVEGTRVAEVHVPGSAESLVLSRDDRGRGGYQLHLYAAPAGGFHEMTDVHHNPVIPFVATDTTPGTPVSADCTKDGFAVTVAQPTHPSGVMFAWDVWRTSYAVSGDQAVPLRQEKVGTSVPDEQLRKDRPELFSRTMFAHC
jgi:hypothetical protein